MPESARARVENLRGASRVVDERLLDTIERFEAMHRTEEIPSLGVEAQLEEACPSCGHPIEFRAEAVATCPACGVELFPDAEGARALGGARFAPLREYLDAHEKILQTKYPVARAGKKPGVLRCGACGKRLQTNTSAPTHLGQCAHCGAKNFSSRVSASYELLRDLGVLKRPTRLDRLRAGMRYRMRLGVTLVRALWEARPVRWFVLVTLVLVAVRCLYPH